MLMHAVFRTHAGWYPQERNGHTYAVSRIRSIYYETCGDSAILNFKTILFYSPQELKEFASSCFLDREICFLCTPENDTVSDLSQIV